MFKLPIVPFYKIERIVRMLPVIKEVFKPASESDSLKLIKQLKDSIHNKNAEIFTLRQNIKDLKKHVWDLEENIENCTYQINILENALTKGG